MRSERSGSRFMCGQREWHPTAFRFRWDCRPWFCCRRDCTNEWAKWPFCAHLQTLKKATPLAHHPHRYSSMLEALRGEFSRRFQGFKRVENDMHMICSPSTFNVDHVPSDVQLEPMTCRLTHFWKSTSGQSHCLIFTLPLKRRTFHTLGGMLRKF